MKITMKYPEEYQRFKYLLEYFVAHLEYIASDYSSSSLGYEKYIKPLVEAESFKSSGQGYNGQAIQSQVSKWDYYTNGQICINVYGANCQSRGTYLNWKGTGNNIMADWKGTHIESLYLLYYDPDSRERFSKDVSFTIKELGLFDNQTPNSNLCNLFDEYNLMIEKTNKKQRVWLWSIKVSEPWQDTLNIGSSAKTIKDFRPFKSRSALRKAYQQDVGNSDLKIPDAYWAFINEVNIGDIVVAFEAKKGNGKQYHMLHGWGIITSDCMLNEQDDSPMSRQVQWRSVLEIPKQNEEMGNSLFFQGTTDKQAQHIKELLNINTEIDMESKYQKYIDLLETNKNLILTGAPGTGKTFIAKKIAEEIGAEVEFVQFHPSYDYTDFMEGLRPIESIDGQIGFKYKEGVFKEFCSRATKFTDAESFEITDEDVLHAIDKFIEENSKEELLELNDQRTVPSLSRNEETLFIRTFWYGFDIKLKHLIPVVKSKEDFSSIQDMAAYLGVSNPSEFDNLEFQDIQKYYKLIRQILESRKYKKPFVFIIDEINRGEINRIFGESFFCIDPGYRGKNGRVNTQYQNIIEDGNIFKNGFYVPNNVYIIGTINDIDRSVESMDFAMRRRFAFVEVTAEESYQNMIAESNDYDENEKVEIKKRMSALNKSILMPELKLGEAYQIGAAYFRKYLSYKHLGMEQAFKMLWNYHLKGLLFEYLRGNQNAKAYLDELEKAYNKKHETNDETDKDNG